MNSWFPSESIRVLLLAGGSGTRMGGSRPKQFLELQGKPILLHSLLSFLEWGLTKEIIIVTHPDHMEETEKICSPYLRERDRIVEGGPTRHESTLRGLDSIQIGSNDLIYIHDAARPFVHSEDLNHLGMETERSGLATLATRNHETVLQKEDNKNQFLDRERIWFMKTPQAIRGDLLKKLPRTPGSFEITDLCTWGQHAGLNFALVESHPYNLKITRPEDLPLAEAILPLYQELISS
ncbi:2-C-methyl-D-erythritol 4-phosphate cytidylyltransferase [Leptospira perolatii]|uniref:2-C-methyl-D-erythritol 4-phosphate cytidylyltransferase n=1 Tax=Leptospira perolatii TaxID=2023191 RepID=A0A2M9ZIN4_9LEPT|nr:IspD/TarI family cytidylyltransferase [Leptospira perolatii]PJZ68447.1 2-C-methyl-D-erythritol 4-phosphate cytidylyltransferase [Leptospira perolatii]PJZ71925.1 2-C-methyl-D-erythritol 4-phosphate cytidylyltransferase [Leptospira perolatii]